MASHRHVCATDEIAELKQAISTAIPPNEALILIDDDKLRSLLNVERRCVLPFLERGGAFWGAPHDSEVAIHEITRLRHEQQVKHVVVARVALWWLEYYSDLFDYLRTVSKCTVKENALIVSF